MPLPAPRALLLDFGGVLVDAPSLPDWPTVLVDRLHDLIGGTLSAEQVTRSLVDGRRDYAAWRDRVSTEHRPKEYSHQQVWREFITRDWPATARDAVLQEATSLSYAWTRRPDWALRSGIREALAVATAAGLPLAIVSNTLCGAAHRDYLAEVGVADLFAAQFYSDEAGVRKPNPEMAWLAAEAIGVPVGQCWFVGDSRARDIPCARRAGAGAAVLMVSPRTDREAGLPDGTPDATVDDGHGLRQLLDQWT